MGVRLGTMGKLRDKPAARDQAIAPQHLSPQLSSPASTSLRVGPGWQRHSEPLLLGAEDPGREDDCSDGRRGSAQALASSLTCALITQNHS